MKTAQNLHPSLLDGAIAGIGNIAQPADCEFQPLDSDARAELLHHYRQLSAADLALRFGATLAPEALERYVAGLDFHRDTMIGARDARGMLAGVVQLMPLGSDHEKAAEIAFSVTPAARGRGLARRLMQSAIVTSRARGISRLIAQVCPRNAPMLAILRGAGMALVREDCEMVGSLPIAPLLPA